MTGTAPTFALPEGAVDMPEVPMRDAAFLVDPLGARPDVARVRIGRRELKVPVPSVADTARIFQSSLDPRLSRMALELLEEATLATSKAVRDTKPRWDIPQRMHGPSTMNLRAGPPQNYRIYAPQWYMDLTRGAQDAMVRREFRIA
jgi:hypothetical protein